MVKKKFRNPFAKTQAIEYSTGKLPTCRDNRDAAAAAFLGAAPTAFAATFELPQIPGVKDQGIFPSCVGQGVDRWIEYANAKEGDPERNSARYIYAKCKEIDGCPTMQGTFTRTALKIASTIGSPLEEEWPEMHSISYAQYIQSPPSTLEKKAAPYRIKNYIAFTTEAEVKQYILQQGLPILMGINGNGSSWGNAVVCNNNYTLVEPMVDKSHPLEGHQVICVGWNQIGWIIENSWSSAWGNKGRATVPYEYSGLEDTDFAPFDLPNDWQTINANYKNMVNEGNMNGILHAIDKQDNHDQADLVALKNAENSGDQATVDVVIGKYLNKLILQDEITINGVKYRKE